MGFYILNYVCECIIGNKGLNKYIFKYATGNENEMLVLGYDYIFNNIDGVTLSSLMILIESTNTTKKKKIVLFDKK